MVICGVLVRERMLKVERRKTSEELRHPSINGWFRVVSIAMKTATYDIEGHV